MHRVLIDCDPGQDDAIALALAVCSPVELELLAVTTVAGNVPEAQTNDNARRVLAWLGADHVPVHHGAARPLLRERRSYFPATEGLRGAGLPEPAMDAAPDHAVDVIRRTVASSPPGSVTLCVLGPMTNVALALSIEPTLAERLAGIAFMGGAIGSGNVTPAAEFNLVADPEAAAVVLRSGARLTMFGLEVCHRATADDAFVEALAQVRTPAASLAVDLLRAYGDEADAARNRTRGRPLYDVCVVAWLLRPSLFAGTRHHVEVETHGRHTAGRTVVDVDGIGGAPPNVDVMTDVDRDGFLALLCERLARAPQPDR